MIYYYLIAEKNYVFKNEPFEEIFRERNNYYNSKKKFVDFWILGSSEISVHNKFIKKFAKKLIDDNHCLIISTNKDFINWLNLRFKNFVN